MNSDEDTIFEYETLTAQLTQGNQRWKGRVWSRSFKSEDGWSTSHFVNENCSGYLQKVRTEEENISALKIDLSALEDKVRIAQMGEDDARLFFLDKVKTSRTRLNELDKKHDDLHKELRELKATERELVDFLRHAESTDGS